MGASTARRSLLRQNPSDPTPTSSSAVRSPWWRTSPMTFVDRTFLRTTSTLNTSRSDREATARVASGHSTQSSASAPGSPFAAGLFPVAASAASHRSSREMSQWCRAGTKRVRQLGNQRAPAPLREPKNRSVSTENVPARAREWTRVPYLSLPRNEGVRGSNPHVGFLRICRDIYRVWQRSEAALGYETGTSSDPFTVGEGIPPAGRFSMICR